jgi:hypothetical protein
MMALVPQIETGKFHDAGTFVQDIMLLLLALRTVALIAPPVRIVVATPPKSIVSACTLTRITECL